MQLAANGKSSITVGGFPIIRWAQTANYGYVPNPRMKNIFMAVVWTLVIPPPPMEAYTPEISKMLGQGFHYQEEPLPLGTSPNSGPIAKAAKQR